MDTGFRFWTDIFKPTPEEADEDDPEINPGVYARELADFMIRKLGEKGVSVRHQIVEDWGHWLEVEHEGDFSLALSCSSIDQFGSGAEPDYADEREHGIYVSPRTPFIRKWFFKKIEVEEGVARLGGLVWEILTAESALKDVYVEERDQKSIDPPEDILLRREPEEAGSL